MTRAHVLSHQDATSFLQPRLDISLPGIASNKRKRSWKRRTRVPVFESLARQHRHRTHARRCRAQLTGITT
jgi:hypothetical protein